ncbi:diguanylate cyclase [Salinispirillum marinum]|uniref:diguanylate cyclase n=2 Tax=Saccharospirillaceae TaxID=255527 RepID=A0ABV8BFM2_9GAMM
MTTESKQRLLDRVGQFRRAVVRVSLFADGQQRALDDELDHLREILRQPEVDDETFEAALAEAETVYDHYVAARAEDARRLGKSFARLNDQLRHYSPDPTFFDHLSNGIEARLRNPQEVELYLNEYRKAQGDLLKDLTSLAAAERTIERVAKNRNELELKGITTDIEQVKLDVYDSITDLANRIHLPVDKQHALQTIIHQLTRTLEWPYLLGLLNELIDLIVSVLNDEQRELEHYLEELNERLTFIRASVQRAKQIQQDFRNDGNQLDARIQQHVDSIRNEMHNATSMDQLKTGIQQELDDIVQSIGTFMQDAVQKERDMDNMMAELVEVIADLEQQNKRIRDAFEKTRQQAMTDSLTGLPNRTAYMQKIEEEFERYQRLGAPLALCVLDVDYFKRINDKLGHTAGDKVLKILARQLQAQLRQYDFIARYGGEEFVILMPGTDERAAVAGMQKLRLAVEKSPFHFKGEPVPITVSIGCAQFQKSDRIVDVFDRADAALYRAKDLGRNRVEVGSVNASE